MIEVDEEKGKTPANQIKKTFKAGINLTQQIAVAPLNYVGNMVDSSQSELENRLKKEFGVNFNHWYFSRENIGTIENVLQMINFTTMDVNHLSPFSAMKYLICYMILQKINRNHRKELIFGDKVDNLQYPAEYFEEIQKIASKCKFYSKYAHGCYGDLMNYVYSGKDLTKIVSININDNNEQFISHTKINPQDLIHSNWEATPYMPAHCITISKERKEVLLCLRGSLNWADAVTDLVFTYLNFSIFANEKTGEKFIKINYNIQTQKDIASDIKDTKKFNYKEHDMNYLEEEKENEFKEIYKGLAHSGIFIAGIELYKKLRPKVIL